MRKILTLSIITILLFSCSADNSEKAETETILENSSTMNFAIGIKKDADLGLVFKTLNALHFDIRQMNGFTYTSYASENTVQVLRDKLNEKPYINTGTWSATTSSVFYYAPEYRTYIVNSFFNMNEANQSDLLNLISTLKLKDNLSEQKNIQLSIPEEKVKHWKTQMLKYPFVKWTETFDQVCISYRDASVISATVPSSGNLNQVIPINLTFQTLNGCGSFGSINETNSGNTKTLKVKAKYEGCFCTQNIGNIQTIYNFTATTTGTHTIKFEQPDGTFLTYTIKIQ
jgi:hypothetical protein